MESVRKLGERLKEVADPLGLELRQFMPVVDFEHEAGHIIQAVFILNEVKAEVSAEQAEFDAQFKDIEKQFVAQKEDDKVSETAQKMIELRERMQRGKSVLDDEDGDATSA